MNRVGVLTKLRRQVAGLYKAGVIPLQAYGLEVSGAAPIDKETDEEDCCQVHGPCRSAPMRPYPILEWKGGTDFGPSQRAMKEQLRLWVELLWTVSGAKNGM